MACLRQLSVTGKGLVRTYTVLTVILRAVIGALPALGVLFRPPSVYYFPPA
jgi:hypothetical protein